MRRLFRIQVIKSQKKDGSGADVLAGIDFFGAGKRDVSGYNEDFQLCQKESGEEVDEDGSGVEPDQPLRPTKRKRGVEAASAKICKKKKKNVKIRKQGAIAVLCFSVNYHRRMSNWNNDDEISCNCLANANCLDGVHHSHVYFGLFHASLFFSCCPRLPCCWCPARRSRG